MESFTRRVHKSELWLFSLRPGVHKQVRRVALPLPLLLPLPYPCPTLPYPHPIPTPLT